MATSSAYSGPSSRRNWQSQITCRYFIHGLCKAGSTCNYAHDRSSIVDKVCKYYKDGKCFYGEKCKFSHDGPASKPAKPAKNSTKKTKNVPVQSSLTQPSTFKLTPLNKPGKKMEVEFPENEFNFASVIHVPEFVPGQPYKGSAKVPSSYSSAAKKTNPNEEDTPSKNFTSKDILCPFAIKGTCRYGDNCCYTHGNICEFCNMACLHPFELEQNKQHKEECIKNHEVSMKESFAFQRSAKVTCSICMDVILDKAKPKDQKFGILTNCTHAFCLECIRKWRSSKECEKKVVRACPVCRVPSNFVCPSDFWVEEKDEKKVLIANYKDALSKKSCKYFSEGTGECPFGANCFYRHAYKDGTLQDRSKAVRRYGNANGMLKTHHPINLWDFLEERDMWDSDDDDFFLFEPTWDEFEDSDYEDYLFYRNLFAGSDSDDDSVEDLMLGINMLGLTLVGAAAASLGRMRDESRNRQENPPSSTTAPSRDDEADDEGDGSDDS